MLYLVTRKDLFDYTKQPCKGSVLLPYAHVERTKAPSTTGVVSWLKEFAESEKADWWKYWCSKGTNHRVEGDYWCRDVVTGGRWFIEINTIDDLKQFVVQVGPVTVGVDNIEINTPDEDY